MKKSIIPRGLLIALLAGCVPSPSLVAEGHSYAYREEPTFVSEKLGAIHFGRDSDALDNRARSTLTRVASQIRQESESIVRIEGNCDPRGGREHNLELGLRRAQAARRFLVASGVTHGDLETVSFGADRAVPGETNEQV